MLSRRWVGISDKPVNRQGSCAVKEQTSVKNMLPFASDEISHCVKILFEFLRNNAVRDCFVQKRNKWKKSLQLPGFCRLCFFNV